MKEYRSSHTSGNPETVAVPREEYEQLKARVERLEAALREVSGRAEAITAAETILDATVLCYVINSIARHALESEDGE